LLLRVWRAACEHGAAIPAVPVADTIKRVDGSRVMETLDRSQLWAAQTPQVFERLLLERVFADPRWELETATDEASMLEALGHSVRIETGERDNLKVTAAEDLAVVETLATESYSR
ncbi:MAG TPA: 2-C-methyl-D-erythritol 4-phosphate cytidylyltransferase, partial [Chloroflexota bacterium]|nr:2-C-methyl-D-erythritol 4-phosphate cytidylyltransferase [Chloroflexota bacterium]